MKTSILLYFNNIDSLARLVNNDYPKIIHKLKTKKMKTINNKMGKLMRTMFASLIILISYTGLSKGEATEKASHSVNLAGKSIRHEPITKADEWASDMTAGWALHMIKHSKLY